MINVILIGSNKIVQPKMAFPFPIIDFASKRTKCNVIKEFVFAICSLDWLQSLKQFFINVSYHILVASLTLMALF